VRDRYGLPLTAPIRTVVDLAQVLAFRELQGVYEEAQVQRLVHPSDLRSVLERSSGIHGAPAIRALAELDRGPAPTRSEAEARMLALLRAAGLPPTDVNVRVGRHEVDFLWRPERLVVEVDGFTYHASRAAFERDRLRDANLQAAGYRVVRITWRQLQERPAAVIARLAQALARA
jgi:very-short-patch-repair endonuclease